MHPISGHADIARGLGDPTRVRILVELAAGERSVGDLVRALGVTQPRVSNHLAVLREAALVRSRRERRTVLNALADGRVAALVAALQALTPPEPAGAAPVEIQPVVDPESMEAVAAGAPAGPRELVVFVLGSGEYALPIGVVREVVRYVPPRPLPGARPGVLGIVQVQGRLLEAVDVRPALGLPGDARLTDFVVVEGGGRSVAMPVEGVREVVHVEPEQLLPPPVASAELDLVAAVGDRLVLLLHPAAILGGA